MINEFKLLEDLGVGGTSTVKLAFCDKDYGDIFAIKIMKKPTDGLDCPSEVLEKEFAVLKRLDHPHIIKLHEVCLDGVWNKGDGTVQPYTPFAVLELIENGEFFDYIANTGVVTEEVAKFYFKQLLGALKYCNEKGVVHRDIKLENLLLDKNFNLKLVDFGFAALFDKGSKDADKLSTLVGTEGYMAPEILKRKHWYSGMKTDVFSLGVILFVMVLGVKPFRHASKYDQNYRMLRHKRYEIFWDHQFGKYALTDEFKDLMNGLLAYDPESRPT